MTPEESANPKVVHIVFSPYEDQAIRLNKAILEHTSFQSHCIVLCSQDNMPHALDNCTIWDEDRKKSIELIRSADILQFHNIFDPDTLTNPFYINFKKEVKSGAQMIFHWHLGFNVKTSPPYLEDDLVEHTKRKILSDDSYIHFVEAPEGQSYLPTAQAVPTIIQEKDHKQAAIYESIYKQILTHKPESKLTNTLTTTKDFIKSTSLQANAQSQGLFGKVLSAIAENSRWRYILLAFSAGLFSLAARIRVLQFFFPAPIILHHEVLAFIFFRRDFSDAEMNFLQAKEVHLSFEAQLFVVGLSKYSGDEEHAKSLLGDLMRERSLRYYLSFSKTVGAMLCGEDSTFKKLENAQTLDGLLQDLKGKTIACVGNSPCEIGLEKGSEIDGHDVVIRFNNFHQMLDSHKRDYGKKTTIWAHSGWFDVEFSTDVLDKVSYVLFAHEGLHVRRQCLPNVIRIFEYCPEKVVIVPLDIMRQINNEAQQVYISTGLRCLCFLKECKLKFNLFGFKLTDQKKGYSSHYFSKAEKSGSIHDWKKERVLLTRIEKYLTRQ
jgi:hypothetical protein